MSLNTSSITILSIFFLLAVGNSLAQTAAGEPNPATQESREAPPRQDHPKHSGPLPDDVPGLQALAIDSYEAGDYKRFMQATMKLRKERPYEQQYLVGMVVGAALIGRPKTAYNYMHVMQQQGLSYDFNSTEDTRSIRGTEVYDYLNGVLIEAGQPTGEAREAFTLPPTSVQPESMAWDDSRGKFLVGTIDTGAVLAITPGGEVTELLRATDDNGLLAITGIAVDALHKRLWLSSAGVPGHSALVPTDMGRGALFEFDLESLELLHRFDLPVDGLPHVPGELAVTPAGDVYFIDRVFPMVFRKPVDAEKVEPYLASKEAVGFRELALSDSGDILYIADAARGILVVNLRQTTSATLATPDTLNLGGISGLSFSGNALFVLQNGITPNRLIRLELDQEGTMVKTVTPLAIALEAFDAPSYGTIEGGALYYFASSNPAGAQGGDPKPTVVLKTPLVLSESIVPPEKRKYDTDVAAKKEKHGI